jgi:hypothetical protein
MSAKPVSLDAAVEACRTGDLWLFRGHTTADRIIQTLTNAPVNHVGMALVLEDMPPMIWHAELGRSLPDLWTGDRHRGVQLHNLRAAVEVWGHRYGQRAWWRQLEPEVSREAEDAAVRMVSRLDGTPFPSTAHLAGRWLRGRVPGRSRLAHAAGEAAAHERVVPEGQEWIAGFPWQTERADPAELAARASGEAALGGEETIYRSGRLRGLARLASAAHLPGRGFRRFADLDLITGTSMWDGDDGGSSLETAYCAEVVAITYQAMGVLPAGRRPNWYDPGRFWSGDELGLTAGYALGAEIAVEVPPE